MPEWPANYNEDNNWNEVGDSVILEKSCALAAEPASELKDAAEDSKMPAKEAEPAGPEDAAEDSKMPAAKEAQPGNPPAAAAAKTPNPRPKKERKKALTSCERSARYRNKNKVEKPAKNLIDGIHCFIIDDTMRTEGRTWDRITIGVDKTYFQEKELDQPDVPQAFFNFPHKKIKNGNRFSHMRNVCLAELFELQDPNSCDLFTNPLEDNADDPFYVAEFGVEDYTFVEDLITRAGTLRRIIPDKPNSEGEYVTTCFNHAIAPYLVEQIEEKLRPMTATNRRVNGEDIKVCWINLSYLNKMLDNDDERVVRGWKYLFSDFIDYLYFCRPDRMERADVLLKHLLSCYNCHVYPPIRNLISYTQPYDGWRRWLDFDKERPGFFNDRVWRGSPFPESLQGEDRIKELEKMTWKEFFHEGVRELGEHQHNEDKWKRNDFCSEIYLTKNGFVMEIHHFPCKMRQGKSKYHISLAKGENGTLKDPLEISVLQLTSPPMIIGRSFKEVMSRTTYDEDGMEHVQWHEYMLEPFTESFWSKELQLYGKINKGVLNKVTQATVGRKKEGHDAGQLKRLGFSPKWNNNLLTKPSHKYRGKEECFTKEVIKELKRRGVLMAEHLPMRVDVYLAERYGPRSLAATLVDWGNFPARDIETVDYAANFVVKSYADEIIKFILHHAREDKIWPRS